MTTDEAFRILPRGITLAIGGQEYYISRFFKAYYMIQPYKQNAYFEDYTNMFNDVQSPTKNELIMFQLTYGYPFITELAEMYLKEKGE